jgi:glycosyltransferase involved in cell wall biosynthesis
MESSELQQTLLSDTGSSDAIRPINVGIVVDANFLYRFQTLFSHILIGLLDQPITVTIIHLDPIPAISTPIGPARMIEFKKPLWPWKIRQAVQSLATEIRSAKINILHSCCGTTAELVNELSTILNIPYVTNFTGLAQEECYLRLNENQCRKLIGISQPICEAIRELYPKMADRVELIRPGCFLRQRINNSDRPKTIIMVADFYRHHGHDVLLQALRELRRRDKECWVIMLGRGPLEYSLRRWINKNDLGRYVTLVEKIANWEEVLSDADFYVQPGSFYSLDSGPYEAFSRGCPIISDGDNAFDLLQDDVTGKVFQSGDYIHLADILTDWLSGRIDWNVLSGNVQETVKRELSPAKAVDKLIACYQSVLE